MKILYHHRTQGRGAEGIHITSIVRALESMGHQVTLLSPPGIDPLKEIGAMPVDKAAVETRGINTLWKLVSRHMPNFIFELMEILYNLHARPRLARLLRENDYDLVYERYAFYLLAGSRQAARHGVPFILEANEVSGIKNRARKQSFPRLCGWFEKRLFSRCGGIITVSSTLRNMILARGVDPGRVIISPNAIDPDKAQVSPNAGTLRDQYQLQGKTVIGAAGWFDEWDRLDILLDAFHDIHARQPDTCLMLVGDGPVLRQLRRDAAILGDSIILTGAVPRQSIFDYLSLFDIAVLPHSNEFGSPVILFEYMGLGKAIVAPALPPITDSLEHEETALIFEPLSRQALAAHIEKLVRDSDLRAQLGICARQTALSRHTWDHNARQIIELYTRITEKRD